MSGTYLVPFLPGNGTEVMLSVIYIAEGYPRGADGTCAFCHGDPCAEYSESTSRIAVYMNTPAWPGGPTPPTCPSCEGRPS